MVLRACAFLLLLSAVSQAQVHKVNGALAAVSDGDVSQFWTSADSAWVFYTADQDTEGLSELYGAPADGSAAAHKVNGTLEGGVSFAFPSPDGARVAFLANGDAYGSMQLYCAPSDGSGPAVRLTTTALVGSSRDAVDVTSTRAVFHGNDAGTFRLYSVPLDGSAAPVVVSAPFPPGFVLSASAVSPTGPASSTRLPSLRGPLVSHP